jgi:hypothetical protein
LLLEIGAMLVFAGGAGLGRVSKWNCGVLGLTDGFENVLRPFDAGDASLFAFSLCDQRIRNNAPQTWAGVPMPAEAKVIFSTSCSASAHEVTCLRGKVTLLRETVTLLQRGI